MFGSSEVSMVQVKCLRTHGPIIMGDSGGVVNPLEFYPPSLKSLGHFYFSCVLFSQWKAVTVNLRSLHKGIFEGP